MRLSTPANKSQSMKIEQAKMQDYPSLIALWEASVRATHHFLPEAEIDALKPLILEHYFAAVDLVCGRDEAAGIVGFCGVHDGNIEMLFIAPEARGCGVGRWMARANPIHCCIWCWNALKKVDQSRQ